MLTYKCSQDLLQDLHNMINEACDITDHTVNISLVQRNWLIGKRIADEVLQYKDRSEYGLKCIKNLSKELTQEFGKGFTKTNLYSFYSFYKTFPEIFHAVSGKSLNLLSWTHYRILLQVKDPKARVWYTKEAYAQEWSIRTLQRNIDSEYYHRLHSSHNPQSVKDEMQKQISGDQKVKNEFLKDPCIADFLELTTNIDTNETQLESAILSHLQIFLLELSKGYAFVARQQHIHTEKQDYYIDLVFYNYLLKCFVLIDLKIGKISHQDVGQMDMYTRMYDDLKRNEGDNPTIGIVLGSETDEDIAKYSVLHGSEQLFASKYKLYLPTEDELRAEIETQKTIFYLQQKEEKSNSKN